MRAWLLWVRMGFDSASIQNAPASRPLVEIARRNGRVTMDRPEGSDKWNEIRNHSSFIHSFADGVYTFSERVPPGISCDE